MFLLKNKFEPQLWQQMCDLGWNAAPVPAAIGGFEGGLVEALLMLIEMGRAGCLTPYPHSSVAASLGLSSLHPNLSADIANGCAVIIPVDAALMNSATLVNGGHLHAIARPVVWAQNATHLLCEVQDRAYLVAMEQPSIKVLPLASSRGEPLSEVRFGGANTTALGEAVPLLATVRDFGAFACAAMLQGISERALELAVAYAKERVQFGRPIGSFQAIQHKAADMHIACQVGRVLVMRAAAEREKQAFSAAASKAKAWNSDTARKVTREAMQIFGGISFAGDHPVQLLYQAVITLANHYGRAHEHRARVAAELLG
jgi:alkylation response protein AidB-like acyl-CoA dehydrogenase